MKTTDFLVAVKAIEEGHAEALNLARLYGKELPVLGGQYWFVERLGEILAENESSRLLSQISFADLVVVEQFRA